MTVTVHIDRSCSLESPDDDSFSRWVASALTAAGRDDKDSELSILICEPDEITDLNSRYRGKAYATNVLSFPADLPPEFDLPLLGDIAICADVVVREAAEQEKRLEHHWAHMTVHGVLHLLGYDHIEDSEADIMEGLEIDILEKLHIPNPYEAPSTHSHCAERAEEQRT